MFGSSTGKERQERVTQRLADLEETSRDVVRRLDDLEGDLEWLSLEVKKIRGKVTGGVRKSHEDDAQPTNGGGSYPVGSPQWFEAQRAILGMPRQGG